MIKRLCPPVGKQGLERALSGGRRSSSFFVLRASFACIEKFLNEERGTKNEEHEDET